MESSHFDFLGYRRKLTHVTVYDNRYNCIYVPVPKLTSTYSLFNDLIVQAIDKFLLPSRRIFSFLLYIFLNLFVTFMNGCDILFVTCV